MLRSRIIFREVICRRVWQGRRTAVALGSELPDADLKYHTSPEQFARDITQAKFCLVVRIVTIPNPQSACLFCLSFSFHSVI